ncbi:hypothetical protein R1flu_027911 [Riccia fluitans]|uniref:GDSL esterase/lipase n=1 Tax=Riccia fluitans TaxID=41844 RepID=A0ABD1XK61_9MARC
MGRSSEDGVFVGDYRLQMVLALMFLATLLGSESGLVPVLGWPGPCPTGIFSFGDSLSDTGAKSNMFPGDDNLPYGEQFFKKPSKRYSNGRLVLDFFALAFGRKPLLQPYIQNGPFDYRFGVNFAFFGATASGSAYSTPVNLAAQISQFRQFKKNTYREQGCSPYHIKLPTVEVFDDALYTLGIGGNDIMNAALEAQNQSYVFGHLIPKAMEVVTVGAKSLYDSGARRFLFFTTPSAGCSTIILTEFRDKAELDSMGCVKFVNENNQAYNAALRSVVTDLRSQFPDAEMDIFDYYGANVEILKNPTAYGFNPEKTMKACCGGSAVGLDRQHACGTPAAFVCANPDEHVNWDGLHFTEQFYRTIAQFVLAGKFSDLGINYSAVCTLDFSFFNSSVTFDQVYPHSSCEIPQMKETPLPHSVM